MKKKNWIPEQNIVAAVRCPFCGVAKDQRCHWYSRRPFGTENGPPCGPHQERRALYRRWLKVQRLTSSPAGGTKPGRPALAVSADE